MERLIFTLFALASVAAYAAENPKPVFIHAACDGKISSAALSSLREEIRFKVAHYQSDRFTHGVSTLSVAPGILADTATQPEV